MTVANQIDLLSENFSVSSPIGKVDGLKTYKAYIAALKRPRTNGHGVKFTDLSDVSTYVSDLSLG